LSVPAGIGFRLAGRWGTVADVMRMLRERAARVAATLAVLLAVGWTASVATLAQTATGDREHQRAVGSLAFRIDDAALRGPRPGSGHLVQAGRQGGRQVPIAAGAVTTVLVAMARRAGRRARLATRRRGPRMPAATGSRAPPAFQLA
jgi:hypothetical protein